MAVLTVHGHDPARAVVAGGLVVLVGVLMDALVRLARLGDVDVPVRVESVPSAEEASESAVDDRVGQHGPELG